MQKVKFNTLIQSKGPVRISGEAYEFENSWNE